MPSSVITPIKEITTTTPRKKNKNNNANILYANTNSPQEIPQNQNISINQQSQALKELNTYQSLQIAMSQSAQQISRSRHQSSNLQQCLVSDSNFVTGQTQYENIYSCRLKGKIIGIRSFEVSVKVRGEIIKQGSDFIGRIVNYEILYDKEL